MSLTYSLNIDTSPAIQGVNRFYDALDQGAARAQLKLAKALGEKVEKEIVFKLSGDKVIGSTIKKLEEGTQTVSRATEALKGKYGQNLRVLREQEKALRKVRDNTEAWNKTTGKLSPQFQRVNKTIGEVQKKIKSLEGSGGSGGLGKIGQALFGISTVANLAARAITAMGQALMAAVTTGFEMEVLALQLEGFTGSAQAAEMAMQQFADIAAKTPFDVKQVANAAKIMMAFGIETNDAVRATEQLAIVSAATGGDLQLLSRNMGQIVAQGRAYTRDLTQFAIQGIPIWDMLSQVTGESASALKEMAKEGQITGKEVSAALTLMTQKGSDFEKIASRMQETFVGRFAQIQSSFQLLSLEMIKAFNDIDKGIGGAVTGSMKALADALKFVADNMQAITPIAGALITTLAIISGPAIIKGLVFLAGKFIAVALAIGKEILAQTTFLGLTGQFALIATAVGAGILVYNRITANIDAANRETVELEQNTNAAADSVDRLSKAEIRLANSSGSKGLAQNYREASRAADDAKTAFEAQLEVVQRIRKRVKERYDDEIKEIQRVMQENEKKVAAADRNLAQETKRVNERYDEEIRQVQRVLDEKTKAHNKEIANLRARTPQEQRLLDFERKQIELKLQKGGLDEGERLRLEARLSRMKRNVEIEKQEIKFQKEKEVLEDKILKLKDDQRQKIQDLKDEHKRQTESLKQDIEKQKQAIEKLEEQRRLALNPLDEAIQKNKDIIQEIQNTDLAIDKNIQELGKLARAWQAVEQQAQRALEKVRAANAEKIKNAAPGGGGDDADFNFAGGPMQGGQLSHVNELGQEAFLSASGKLSMINAKPWEVWKAPNKGTVIPAHLTKQLDIPSGGINLNRAASAQVAKASGTPASLVRAIKGISGRGDTVTNNVTIQAANTTQAASDMMVQLNRIRRRRMG